MSTANFARWNPAKGEQSTKVRNSRKASTFHRSLFFPLLAPKSNRLTKVWFRLGISIQTMNLRPIAYHFVGKLSRRSSCEDINAHATAAKAPFKVSLNRPEEFGTSDPWADSRVMGFVLWYLNYQDHCTDVQLISPSGRLCKLLISNNARLWARIIRCIRIDFCKEDSFDEIDLILRVSRSLFLSMAGSRSLPDQEDILISSGIE